MRKVLYPVQAGTRLSILQAKRLESITRKANVTESAWIRSIIAPHLESSAK